VRILSCSSFILRASLARLSRAALRSATERGWRAPPFSLPPSGGGGVRGVGDLTGRAREEGGPGGRRWGGLPESAMGIWGAVRGGSEAGGGGGDQGQGGQGRMAHNVLVDCPKMVFSFARRWAFFLRQTPSPPRAPTPQPTSTPAAVALAQPPRPFAASLPPVPRASCPTAPPPAPSSVG
jgi:hypothetical protein